MKPERLSLRVLMMSGAAAAAVLCAGGAKAQDRPINIAPQSLTTALYELGVQTGQQIIFTPALASSKTTLGVSRTDNVELALQQMLEGTGLSYQRTADAFLIVQQEGGSSPQSAGAGGDVDALIVTAQKREENIQDVPIAISAFTQKNLEEQKIEGGFDLLKAIPNVTFSKSNFSSYNFSIRGIGTKAVSATTDPGVAVSFNNVALIQNRLFEQEYFDVERVEVLRGPQGTLYGRNATAGVINVISAKPDMDEFKGSIKGEVGNYKSKRIVAMINVPLVEDKLAVRFAGSMTNRDGYDYNTVTDHAVNGRDLWSGRVSVGFNPTERFRANLIWERFNEDDNRSRTGKQLCHRDPGPVSVGNMLLDEPGNIRKILRRAGFSTGCKPGSLYDDMAFGTPNGLALPFVFAILQFTGYCGPDCNVVYPIGFDQPRYINGVGNPNAKEVSFVARQDPYGGMMQSRNLRDIASFRDPVYRAKADVIQLNFDWDLSEHLMLTSQTVYNKDLVYSFQDFNRFNTVPIFENTSNLYSPDAADYDSDPVAKTPWAGLAPGGVFCDPQLGCSNTMAGFDISTADGEQFTQELRLQSSFDGPINFSIGANYTSFDVVAEYYVMYNLITAAGLMIPFNNQGDYTKCGFRRGEAFEGSGSSPIYELDTATPPLSMEDPNIACPYIDPNPVESISGDGHNYYRSLNPYQLRSSAVFGEFYWELAESLKITAGLRYTDDRKTFTPYPTQVLLAPTLFIFGTSYRGLQPDPDIKQHWGEFTGRLGVDWKPDLGFTNNTMVYAFYSHGYKGGGANPPPVGFHPLIRAATPRDYGDTFEPEFIDALEAGTKNTLAGGALMFNASAFYYDYKDYQVSKVVDRSVANENFDATVWGLEFETLFSPSRNLRLNANLGYLDTKIAEGMKSIDITNRTQGNPNYVVAKPFVTQPSNCIAPIHVAEAAAAQTSLIGQLCSFNIFGSDIIDPATGTNYDKSLYPEINQGLGFWADLSGKELPNSPHWTTNIGVQYGYDFPEGWRATIRADGYWQSQSWARVYNAVNDKLHGWYNANLSLWIENEDGLKIEIYAKNVLDKTPITDAFINSDDTALTTNVFVLDPRLIGLSIRQEF